MASVAVRRSASLKPVHAAACARPCSNETQAGREERQDRDRDDHERRGDADDEGREGAGEGVHQAPAGYSSSSVRACSHQVSTMRSAGAGQLSSTAARPSRVRNGSRSVSRMSRRPSMPAWMNS